MSFRQKYFQILAGIVPIGAAGVALLLGSTAPAVADQGPEAMPARAVDAVSVAARLAAIREAVSDVGGSAAKSDEGGAQLAWWAWRNGGGGWRNGGGAWRNGGGAWHNGGWHNYWRNY